MTLETTTRRPVLVDATPPDDSRDCCRAAQQIMGDDFHDAKSLVDDTLALIFSALMDDDAPAETLRRFIGDAQSAMARVSADLDRIGALVRHGTGDLRKIDAMLAARAQALDEGREPPYEPSWGEVRGAMAGAQSAGKPITEAEAAALLKAQAQQENWT